ncbi:GTPase Era [Blattabacterium cuenoti]|uniref:GTPase Era n=1 Tax=Blattabacterium cuenoti TaxID=1653831 RepID=UPI00163C1F89|nr:GTPase Era [Blattabacterium cuenoti]
MIHKSGFVSIVGKANVGKSTLMNSILDKKLSITTYKPQTTRHNIIGILNKPGYQMIFCDTPGFIEHGQNILQNRMIQYVKKSLKDVDIILLITEIGKFQKKSYLFNIIKEKNIPIIIVINKIDKIVSIKEKNIYNKTIKYWKNILDKTDIISISALKDINKNILIEKIQKLLPEHPPFYPKEFLTDKPKRFFVNEIIREKIFLLYKKEIPYITEVETEIFNEKKNCIYITSFIFVERNSQKNILIGKLGKSIYRLKYYSENSIKNFFDKEIKLNIYIKIFKKWYNDYKRLKMFGY